MDGVCEDIKPPVATLSYGSLLGDEYLFLLYFDEPVNVTPNLENEVDVSLSFPNEVSTSDWSLTPTIILTRFNSFDFKIKIA